MAIRDIRLAGDEILRKVSEPVKELTPEITELINDMFDTMYELDGAGLAAPQVGVSLRILVADVGDNKQICLINPVLEKEEMRQYTNEKCLSFPGVRRKLRRPCHIIVKGLDRDFKEITIDTYGELARCICHEIDHLDGILFTDRN